MLYYKHKITAKKIEYFKKFYRERTMDEKQNGRNQSGYDQKTFGETSRGSYQKDTFGQGQRDSSYQDSYNYSQKYNGRQGTFGQPGTGSSHAQYGQAPPDGGAFYHSGQPPQGMGFGIASMVLGIMAIVLSCFCINIPVAIVAIIFGIVHISRRTGNNGFAIAGIVTSIVSVILTVILTIVLYVMGVNSAASWLYYDGYLPFEYNMQDDYDGYDDYEDFFDGNEYEGVDL